MTKGKTAIVACVIAAVTAALWSAMYISDKRKVEYDNRMEIISYKNDDIKEIHVKNANGEFRLINNENTWLTDSTDEALDELSLNGYLSMVMNVKGEKIGNGDAEQYGLDNPTVTTQYNLTDGSTKKIYLGDKTPAGTEYYVMDEDNNIYTIYTDIGDKLKTDIFSLINTFIYGTEYDKLQKVKISGNKNYELVRKPNGVWMYNNTPVSDEIIKRKITRYIGGMYANGILKASDENLNKYGFNNISAEVSITDTDGNTVIFFIGAITDDGTYCMLRGKNIIYKVVSSYFEYIDFDGNAF